jgi:hypothetical protein
MGCMMTRELWNPAARVIEDLTSPSLIIKDGFAPPWSVEELDDCFVVRDQNGQQLAYILRRRV